MNALFSRTLLLAWAVWLGGLVGLLTCVLAVFKHFAPDRIAAGDVATDLFKSGEKLLLIAGAAAVISALGLLVSQRSKLRTLLLTLLILAAAIATSSTLLVSPRIDAMRAARNTTTDSFKQLHGLSSTLYVAQAGLLALSGLLLPNTLRPTPTPTRTDTPNPSSKNP